jgi:hypothetical protein
MKLDELEVATVPHRARAAGRGAAHRGALGEAASTSGYPAPAYAWYVVAVLMLAYVSSFIDRQIPSLLVVPIHRDLGISDTQMSLLMGLSFALFYTVLGLPIGRLADSRSRRGIIAAGVAVWSLMERGVRLGEQLRDCSWPGSESGWGKWRCLRRRTPCSPTTSRASGSPRRSASSPWDLPRLRAGVLSGRGHRRAHRQRRDVTTAHGRDRVPLAERVLHRGPPGPRDRTPDGHRAGIAASQQPARRERPGWGAASLRLGPALPSAPAYRDREP